MQVPDEEGGGGPAGRRMGEEEKTKIKRRFGRRKGGKRPGIRIKWNKNKRRNKWKM
jgi:hypothetical protein